MRIVLFENSGVIKMRLIFQINTTYYLSQVDFTENDNFII